MASQARGGVGGRTSNLVVDRTTEESALASHSFVEFEQSCVLHPRVVFRSYFLCLRGVGRIARAKGYLLEMGGDSGGSELNVEVRRESWHGLHIRTDNGRRMLSAISDSCCVCRSLDKGVTAKPERLTSYAGIRTGNRVRLGFVPTFSLAWEPDLKAWMIQSC